jgi:hypothetical protein
MELIEQKEEIVSLLEDIRGQLRAELGERITEDWIIKVRGSFFFFSYFFPHFERGVFGAAVIVRYGFI